MFAIPSRSRQVLANGFPGPFALPTLPISFLVCNASAPRGYAQHNRNCSTAYMEPLKSYSKTIKHFRLFHTQTDISMRTFTLIALFASLFSHFVQAQTGCPGCSVNVPAGLPADTVYLPALPDGQVGTPYDQDLSFRLPKTTNPVHAIDSTTPPGLTISKFDIVSVDGLPAGMYWQPNKFTFDMSTETDGCVKFCGTPYQSDTFHLVVTLKATVVLFAQEATFPMTLYIAPKVSNTTGFSMSNPEGCGETTVSFTNHIASEGHAGFNYTWDFGDGSPVFNGENPPPHHYNTVGTHVVSYHATIDTVGYVLQSIRVLSGDCSDAIGLGAPDMYLQIFAPNNGPKLYDSSPDVPNISLPYTFPVNLKLDAGNYFLKVMDEDSGLEGSDDLCGSLNFNYLSDDTLVSGGLTVVMSIAHPVDEIYAQDTVVVYPAPTIPALTAPNGVDACVGETDLVLVSSYGSGNQWLLNGNAIAGATDFIYKPTETGYYQARIISQFGCVANSDSIFVEFHELPQQPVWYNHNNSLRLYDTTALPAQYTLQWYKGTNPIPGETGFWYCSMDDGNYGLVVTDVATGCTNSYYNLVQHNANYDCTVGTQSIDNQKIGIVPNPAFETATVHFPASSSDALLRVWDMTGRLLLEDQAPAGSGSYTLDVQALHAGIFTVELLNEGQRYTGKLVVVR